MKVHISKLPQIVLGTDNLEFAIGHRVNSVPILYLEDDNIVYQSRERPNLCVSNTRAVFFHSFTVGLNLYETTGMENDIVVYDPMNPMESSSWPRQIFYATAELGFALYKAQDEKRDNLAYLSQPTHLRRSDDADGEVWLEVHVQFHAGPGQTVIGQRRRINKNTGEIEFGQTFVQPIDVALESYAELGRAIEEALNPSPDPGKVIKLPVEGSKL